MNEYEAHDKRIWSIDFCAPTRPPLCPAPTTAPSRRAHRAWSLLRNSPIFCRAPHPLTSPANQEVDCLHAALLLAACRQSVLCV